MKKTRGQKLVMLCQGNLLVKAFWLHFKALANQFGLSEKDLLERFKTSLNKNLLMKMFEVHADKKSLAMCTCTAIELDLNCHQAKNITGAKKGNTLLHASGDAQLATALKKHSLDLDAMDANTITVCGSTV
jgi:AraC-like DNA-binding protein